MTATVLLTGGNSGIGKETAVVLARRGLRVVITARDAERGETAVDEIRDRSGSDTVEVVGLDLMSFADVRRATIEVLERCPRLDVLINNAGVVLSERRLTDDGCEQTWQTNHLGPFLLTKLLVDRLLESAPSRIVNVASVAHRQATGIDLDDLTSPDGDAGLSLYARTKLANVLFTRALARRLPDGVTTYAVHPGTVRSGFGRDGDTSGFFRLLLILGKPVLPSPKRGARGPSWLATVDDPGVPSGSYFSIRRPQRPSAPGRDDDLAERLWEHSEHLVGSPAEA